MTPHVVTVKKVAFKATIKGSMSLLWSDSSVDCLLGDRQGRRDPPRLARTLTGNGMAPFSGQSTCEPISGKGVLSGAGSKLMLNVSASTSQAGQACGADQAAPTAVTVSKGVAKITGGTGKWKGVSRNPDLQGHVLD